MVSPYGPLMRNILTYVTKLREYSDNLYSSSVVDFVKRIYLWDKNVTKWHFSESYKM